VTARHITKRPQSDVKVKKDFRVRREWTGCCWTRGTFSRQGRRFPYRAEVKMSWVWGFVGVWSGSGRPRRERLWPSHSAVTIPTKPLRQTVRMARKTKTHPWSPLPPPRIHLAAPRPGPEVNTCPPTRAASSRVPAVTTTTQPQSGSKLLTHGPFSAQQRHSCIPGCLAQYVERPKSPHR